MSKPRKTLRIAAAICTYERHDLLPLAIESVRRQSLAEADYRVVVVDNSPPSSRRTRSEQAYDGSDGIQYVTVDTPGLSNARNVANEVADADVIAYLDDDAQAEPEWLEQVLHAFDTFGDSAGVVGGRIDPIWPIERPAWLADDMLGSLTVVDHGGPLREKRADEWIAGANFSVRSEALDRVGGFSTNLGRTGSSRVLLSNEDSAMVDKLEAAGFKAIWAPDAAVRHRVDPERLTIPWFRRRMAWQAVSDFVADPEGATERAASQWDNVTRFVNRLPPRLRTPRGFFEDLSDPELARQQIGVAYSATVLLLAGYQVEGLEPS